VVGLETSSFNMLLHEVWQSTETLNCSWISRFLIAADIVNLSCLSFQWLADA
jgi:hypothetical protein